MTVRKYDRTALERRGWTVRGGEYWPAYLDHAGFRFCLHAENVDEIEAYVDRRVDAALEEAADIAASIGIRDVAHDPFAYPGEIVKRIRAMKGQRP